MYQICDIQNAMKPIFIGDLTKEIINNHLIVAINKNVDDEVFVLLQITGDWGENRYIWVNPFTMLQHFPTRYTTGKAAVSELVNIYNIYMFNNPREFYEMLEKGLKKFR